MSALLLAEVAGMINRKFQQLAKLWEERGSGSVVFDVSTKVKRCSAWLWFRHGRFWIETFPAGQRITTPLENCPLGARIAAIDALPALEAQLRR